MLHSQANALNYHMASTREPKPQSQTLNICLVPQHRHLPSTPTHPNSPHNHKPTTTTSASQTQAMDPVISPSDDTDNTSLTSDIFSDRHEIDSDELAALVTAQNLDPEKEDGEDPPPPYQSEKPQREELSPSAPPRILSLQFSVPCPTVFTSNIQAYFVDRTALPSDALTVPRHSYLGSYQGTIRMSTSTTVQQFAYAFLTKALRHRCPREIRSFEKIAAVISFNVVKKARTWYYFGKKEKVEKVMVTKGNWGKCLAILKDQEKRDLAVLYYVTPR